MTMKILAFQDIGQIIYQLQANEAFTKECKTFIFKIKTAVKHNHTYKNNYRNWLITVFRNIMNIDNDYQIILAKLTTSIEGEGEMMEWGRQR